VEQAQIQLDQLKLAAALEVRQALSRLASANEALLTALKTEELAREGLRLAQLRYDESVGILVDVTTAQAQLTSASLSASIARFSALTALAELNRALGADTLETRP
jgi:outer membrane protein TolC